MTDFITAARRELVGVSAVTSLVGSSADWDTWIFRESSYVSLENTGEAMIVLSQRGGWAPPNAHNTAMFPRLQVEVFVDPTRNTERNPVVRTPHERVREIVTQLDLVFHIPQGGEIAWDDVRILGSKKEAEPDITDVPDGDGMVRAVISYEVSLG